MSHLIAARSSWFLAGCLAIQLLASPQSVSAEDWKYPLGVAKDKEGRVLLADRTFHGVLALKDGQLTPLYQGSNKFRTPLNAVYPIHAAADGTIYVGDSATREVYALSPDGKLTALTSGRGSDVPKEEYHPGKIGLPTQIATNSQGDIFATDLELQRVWKIPKGGGEPAEFAVLAGPRGVAVDAEGNVLILTSQAPQLRRFAPDGKQTQVVVADLKFEFPHQVIVRPDGEALVSDGYAKTIWKVSKDGVVEKLFSGDPLVNPVGVAFSGEGESILVIDPRAPGLFEIQKTGEIKKLYPPASP